MLFFFYEALTLFLWSSDLLYSLVTRHSRACLDRPLHCKDIPIWRDDLEWRTKASSTVLLQFSYQAFWREVIGPEPDMCEELLKAMYLSVRLCSHWTKANWLAKATFNLLFCNINCLLANFLVDNDPQSHFRVPHFHHYLTVYNKLWYLPSHIVTSESWCLQYSLYESIFRPRFNLVWTYPYLFNIYIPVIDVGVNLHRTCSMESVRKVEK